MLLLLVLLIIKKYRKDIWAKFVKAINEFEMIKYFHWLGELNIHHGYVDDYIQYKEEQLYLKMAMLDCLTCTNYKKECDPEKNM